MSEPEVRHLTGQHLARLLKRPPVLMAMGVVLSIGLGLCLLTVGYALSNPSHSTPAALISSAPEPAAYADLETDEVLHLIDKTQSAIATQFDEPSKVSSDNGEAFSLLGLEQAVRDIVPLASGRPDPFAPLVKEVAPGDEEALPGEEAEKDVLADVVYSGFIKDVNSARNTAIIKVAGTSVIKKAGESFYVDGARVLIKGVSARQLNLQVNGASRSLPISVSYETASALNAATSTGSPGAAAGASGTGGTASGGAAAEKSTEGGILKLDEL